MFEDWLWHSKAHLSWLGQLRPSGAAVTLNVVFPRIGISLMGRPPRQFHGVFFFGLFCGKDSGLQTTITTQEAVIEVEVAMDNELVGYGWLWYIYMFHHFPWMIVAFERDGV